MLKTGCGDVCKTGAVGVMCGTMCFFMPGTMCGLRSLLL